MRVPLLCLAIAASVMALSCAGYAGGPLLVGGPAVGVEGQPVTWDAAAMPIRYRVDSGPLSRNPSGAVVIDNAAGVARVQAMFKIWSDVPTASISYAYAGPLLPSGTLQGSDVRTLDDYNAVLGSCRSGVQNPVIFDDNGSVMRDLGLDPFVYGFAGICAIDSGTGRTKGGYAILNGRFQDGVSDYSTQNGEMTAAEFDEGITHELGHFSGLDHSQINGQVLTQQPANACALDWLSGLPLMFPISYCQSRVSAGLPALAPDDIAWISKLYPGPSFSTSYGTISGTIFFPDGTSQAQGVNVIARRVDDPGTPEDESLRFAYSAVSGFRFTGNPGQNITGDNTRGSKLGSRDPQLIGYYEIPVPPGTYTIEIEAIDPRFDQASSVGPLDPPAPLPGTREYWDKSESAFDDPNAKDTITVAAGQSITGINIILNRTLPRFDSFEDSGSLYDFLPLWGAAAGKPERAL